MSINSTASPRTQWAVLVTPSQKDFAKLQGSSEQEDENDEEPRKAFCVRRD